MTNKKKNSAVYISILKTRHLTDADPHIFIRRFLLFAGQQERIFRNLETVLDGKRKTLRREGKVPWKIAIEN